MTEAEEIVHRVGCRRLVTPMTVLGANFDTTLQTFEVPQVIGADDAPTGLPMYDGLHANYARAIPKPKQVRVDCDASYAEFRDARRGPYLEELAERVAALEEMLAQHVTDDREVADALARHVAQAVHGGDEIPMPRGTSAWLDGDEILCSVRVMGSQGPKVITTGVPLSSAVDEVVVGALDGDIEPETVLGLVPVLACVLGAGGLVPQMCRAISARPELLGREGVSVLAANTDPNLAAAMGLLQRAQQGDQRANAEVLALRDARRGLMKRAGKQLDRGQRDKARGRS